MSENNNIPENKDEIKNVVLENLEESSQKGASLKDLEKFNDIELPVRVIFANIDKTIEEVMAMNEGDLVELNRFAGEPVDVFVGDRLVAKAEITTVDDCFGARIVEILPSGERLTTSKDIE